MVRTVNRVERAGVCIFLIIGGCLILGAGLFVSADEALLQMRVSGVHFSTDGRTVSSFLGGRTTDLQLCEQSPNQVQAVMGFTSSETTYLCPAYKAGRLLPYVAHSVMQQRVGGDAMAATGLLMLILTGIQMHRMSEAKKLKAWVDEIDRGAA